jgi:hypothetical protein
MRQRAFTVIRAEIDRLIAARSIKLVKQDAAKQHGLQ